MAARDASTSEEEYEAEDEEGREAKAKSSVAQKATASYWVGVGSTRGHLVTNCASLLHVDSLLIADIE